MTRASASCGKTPPRPIASSNPAPGRRVPGHPAGDPPARTRLAAGHQPLRRAGQGRVILTSSNPLPHRGFQRLQLGVVIRGPDVLDIPRPGPRRIPHLHCRRTGCSLHCPLIPGHRASLRPRFSAQPHSLHAKEPHVSGTSPPHIHDREPSQERTTGREGRLMRSVSDHPVHSELVAADLLVCLLTPLAGRGAR
jgi:hypothetical protein